MDLRTRKQVDLRVQGFTALGIGLSGFLALLFFGLNIWLIPKIEDAQFPGLDADILIDKAASLRQSLHSIEDTKNPEATDRSLAWALYNGRLKTHSQAVDEFESTLATLKLDVGLLREFTFMGMIIAILLCGFFIATNRHLSSKRRIN